MEVIKQHSSLVTRLWFERGSTCKRMWYIAPCNSINILTLAQKLLLQALVGARRSGRMQGGKCYKQRHEVQSYVLLLFTKLRLTTCILFQALNNTKGLNRSHREESVLTTGHQDQLLFTSFPCTKK